LCLGIFQKNFQGDNRNNGILLNANPSLAPNVEEIKFELLYCERYQRRRFYLPDEIHEHVGRGDVTDGTAAKDSLIGSFAWMDSQDEDDTQNDSADGGGHIVDDGSRTDPSRHGKVQRADG
jgi:hypothetical protein